MNKEKLNNKIVQNNVLLAERIKECPECGSKDIITDYKRAEISCADCGAIIAENIVDLGPEWRAYNTDEIQKNERTFPTSPYRADNGLGTPRDAKIPGLKMHGKRQVGKVAVPNEKTLWRAFGEANRICVNLGLPTDIEHQTIELCKKAQKKKLFRGAGIERAVAAIVLISCRKQKIPIIMSDLCDTASLKRKGLLSTYRKIARELEISIPANDNLCEFLPRFCAELGLNMEIENLAGTIILNTKNNGKKPAGIYAAAIYIATQLCGYHLNQNDIAKIVHTTSPTLRKRMEEMTIFIPQFMILDKM